MTNNFELFKEILNNDLEFNNNKNYYYTVEIVRRGKDHPELPAANYHFRNYYIFEPEQLDLFKNDIKTICDIFKMRAYISVNLKDVVRITKDTCAEYARRIAVGDFKRPYAIYESCSGKNFVGTSKFVIDIDSKTVNLQDVINLVNSCKNNKRFNGKFYDNYLYTVPTKNGYHLLTYRFDRTEFKKNWNFDIEFPTIYSNHITLLYENI